jgi:hypothetical protein
VWNTEEISVVRTMPLPDRLGSASIVVSCTPLLLSSSLARVLYVVLVVPLALELSGKIAPYQREPALLEVLDVPRDVPKSDTVMERREVIIFLRMTDSWKILGMEGMQKTSMTQVASAKAQREVVPTPYVTS